MSKFNLIPSKVVMSSARDYIENRKRLEKQMEALELRLGLLEANQVSQFSPIAKMLKETGEIITVLDSLAGRSPNPDVNQQCITHMNNIENAYSILHRVLPFKGSLEEKEAPHRSAAEAATKVLASLERSYEAIRGAIDKSSDEAVKRDNKKKLVKELMSTIGLHLTFFIILPVLLVYGLPLLSLAAFLPMKAALSMILFSATGGFVSLAMCTSMEYLSYKNRNRFFPSSMKSIVETQKKSTIAALHILATPGSG